MRLAFKENCCTNIYRMSSIWVKSDDGGGRLQNPYQEKLLVLRLTVFVASWGNRQHFLVFMRTAVPLGMPNLPPLPFPNVKLKLNFRRRYNCIRRYNVLHTKHLSQFLTAIYTVGTGIIGQPQPQNKDWHPRRRCNVSSFIRQIYSMQLPQGEKPDSTACLFASTRMRLIDSYRPKQFV